MFIESIFQGLTVLRFWQVWVGLVCYAGGTFAYLYFIGSIAGKEESGARMATGCLTYGLGGPVVQGIMLSFLVVFLTPILLGGSETVPLSALAEFWWPIAKAGLIATVAGIALAFIPIIGQMVGPGIQSFVQSVLVFRFFTTDIIQKILHDNAITGSVYPGFWASIGYLIVAGIVVRLIFLGVGVVQVSLQERGKGELLEVFTLVIAPVFSLLGGLIPLMMYSQYVRLSIQQALQ